MLTHGSLFSGIGGFDLGFERCSIETVWQVEIDDYCRRVLAKHFPHAQRFADIRECGKHNLAPVDILSGGFPCQDISNAGKRAGIDGERSGLWSEYARIIRELRPRFVVVENVAALLGRGMERVLGDLAACGYDAEWQSIRASDVGAPHRRERIWIVAYPSRYGWREGFAEPSRFCGTERIDGCGASLADASNNGNGRRKQFTEGGESARDVADADGGRREQYHESERRFSVFDARGFRDAKSLRFERTGELGQAIYPENGGQTLSRSDDSFRSAAEWWAIEPDVGRVAHGIPARVDRLRGLGNAIVPQIAEWIGRQIVRVAC